MQLSVLSLLFVSIAVLFLTVPAHALEVPKLQGRVNDYAGMLSPHAKANIEQMLIAVEQSDSTQVVILTVPSLQGEVLEQFSIKVAEKWKIGQKGKDNGVILLVAKNDRKMRIEVGRGLEGTLTDLAAGRIIDNVIKPSFKAGDFDRGFTEGILSIIKASGSKFRGVYQPQQKPPVPGSFSTITGVPWGFYVLVIVIYIGIFFFGKISKILGSGLGAFFTPLAAGMLSLNPLSNLTKLLFAVLGIGIGYGLSIMGSSKLRIAQEYLSNRLSREAGSGSGSSYGGSSSDSGSSSGGGSGGGGGSFGGGGASGSW